MSYAIIRNAKYKRENLKAVYRHNERKNKNYSNKDIDKTKSYLNYALKEPEFNYEKQIDKIREKYDLKGQIKTVSNIVCEYVITSDNDFFKRIGEKEKEVAGWLRWKNASRNMNRGAGFSLQKGRNFGQICWFYFLICR